MSIAPTRMIERTKRRHPAAEREACVVEVHEHSPPTLFHSGEPFRLERLPVGSRIVYPPPPLKGLIDVDAAICAALDSPLGMDPLDSLLSPGMKLDDRLRRHQPAAAADEDARHPRPRDRARARARLPRRRRGHPPDRRARAAPPDDAGRAQARRRRRGSSTSSIPTGSTTTTPRTRTRSSTSARPATARPSSFQARRRVRPADLREHQHRHDGRRPQVGRGRARARTTASRRTTTSTRCATRSPSWTRRSPSCTTAPTARATSSRPPSRSSTSRRRSTTTCTTGRSRSWPSPRRAGRRASRRPSRRSKRTTDRMNPKLRRAAFHKSAAPYAVTGVHGRRGRARARGHARALRAAAGRRRPRPGRHRHRRAALPRPVQRQLDPQPDPRHVHGARVLLQPLPGRAARARGRRDDLHAPGHARVPPGPSPVVRRLLRGGAERDDRPGGDREALREELRRGRVVPPPVPDELRLPRRAPVLHVVLGRARAPAPGRRDLRRRRPRGLPPAWASAAPTRCATRWRWPSRSSAAIRR